MMNTLRLSADKTPKKELLSPLITHTDESEARRVDCGHVYLLGLENPRNLLKEILFRIYHIAERGWYIKPIDTISEADHFSVNRSIGGKLAGKFKSLTILQENDSINFLSKKCGFRMTVSAIHRTPTAASAGTLVPIMQAISISRSGSEPQSCASMNDNIGKEDNQKL